MGTILPLGRYHQDGEALSERIYKLQPNRTIQLRGFDDLGASASLHSATSSSFKVSGVFRDSGDFAVLMLYDADNFYEHPRFKHLPDTDFSGLTLTFDVHYSGLMPLDSPKYPTIDWPYLDVIRPNGTTVKVPLFAHAVLAGGTYSSAEGSFVIEDNGIQAYDRITLWYLNFAFDYIVPNDPVMPTAAQVASTLASQINSVNWEAFGTLIPISAVAQGSTLRVIADRPGADGNMVRMYAVAKNERLKTTDPVAAFQGGSSDATWRVTLDFEALGIPEIRQMWLTFAPPLVMSPALPDTEWEATFTNWTLTGPEGKRALPVAGPGSVRIEEDDSWCRYSGNWVTETGFFSKGYAKRALAAEDSVTIFYSCASGHELFVGTSLYTDRGIVGVSVDGDQETDLDCHLAAEPAVVTRRKIRSAVTPGPHTVTIRLKSAAPFYFDFLEAAVASDVPEPLPALTRISPALDYSTDHTYKLPPARILWMFDQLGFSGPMNEYIGVFWWNQRRREDATIPAVTVNFAGEFLPDDQVFLSIGGQACGKTMFPNENPAVIARHFAQFINATYVGVWAAAEGGVLTVTARSPRPAYSFAFDAWKESSQNSSGSVTFTGSLQNGDPGRWVVDPSQSPALNRGARDWHLDFVTECGLRGREVTLASSMEIVNPPADFGARFPDGEVVETSVGFGSLVSTHCAFSSPMLNYQKQVFKTLADIMAAAGVTPSVQFGEFCWWYFNNSTGMAYYDDETRSAATAAMGRPLHVFAGPHSDPLANSGPDATFLRDRLRDYVSSLAGYIRSFHAAAKIELLYPFDVNHPTPAGVHLVGGRLNRFLNLPIEWEQKSTSGFDRLKVEALDFGAWSRDLNLTRAAVRFGFDLGWPGDSLRQMVPIFQPGYPWQKECLTALGEGMSAVNLWAFDHMSLYNVEPSPFVDSATAKRQG